MRYSLFMLVILSIFFCNCDNTINNPKIRTGNLYISVVDSINGNPIPYVSIWAGSGHNTYFWQVTDYNGLDSIRSVAVGPYELKFSASKYLKDSINILIAEGNQHYEIKIRPTGEVSDTVRPLIIDYAMVEEGYKNVNGGYIHCPSKDVWFLFSERMDNLSAERAFHGSWVLLDPCDSLVSRDSTFSIDWVYNSILKISHVASDTFVCWNERSGRYDTLQAFWSLSRFSIDTLATDYEGNHLARGISGPSESF